MGVGLALVLLVGASVLAVEPAGAITGKQATKKALAALGVTRGKHDVIVFGLSRPLRASQSVTIANGGNLGIGRVTKTQRAKLRPLARKAWLFWADLVPWAQFTHPSRMVLIDDETGRVVRSRYLMWYPLVDGRRPPFLRDSDAYERPRWQVFRRIARPTSFEPVRVRELVRAGEHAAVQTAEALPAGSFGHDCVLLLGAHQDEKFKADFAAMTQFGKEVGRLAGLDVSHGGAKVWYATRLGKLPSKSPPVPADMSDGTKPPLRADVKYLIDRQGCRDILIYVAGHGTPNAKDRKAFRRWLTSHRLPLGVIRSSVAAFSRAGDAEPAVTIGKLPRQSGTARVTLTELKLMLRSVNRAYKDGKDGQKITFKFKIQSCFSGRFKPLIEEKNVVFVEASSAAWEPSFFAIRDRRLLPPGRAKNPKHVSEFTHSNVQGLRTYLTTTDPRTMKRKRSTGALEADLGQYEGRYSPLVLVLLRSFLEGESHDASGRLGWTTPTTWRTLMDKPDAQPIAQRRTGLDFVPGAGPTTPPGGQGGGETPPGGETPRPCTTALARVKPMPGNYDVTVAVTGLAPGQTVGIKVIKPGGQVAAEYAQTANADGQTTAQTLVFDQVGDWKVEVRDGGMAGPLCGEGTLKIQ